MRRGSTCDRRRLIALGCALALAVTGCGPLARGGAGARPPAGGWPQPVGGRVTTKMCGLLTKADYTALGHDRRPGLAGSVNDLENTVDCRHESADDLTLTLEPTADFAKYVFAAGLTDHKAHLAEGHRKPALAGGVVGVADESWFDYWTPDTAKARPVAHELRLRRGSLILAITLSGVRGSKEKDPRSVLVALAGLVLRRLPHVGVADTGSGHRIEYEVFGTGRARAISWEDYTSFEGAGGLADARLPWLHVVPMASAAGATPDPPVLRVEAASPSAKVGCLIVIDGVPVAVQRPRKGFARCQGTFPDSGEGSPSSAQPAAFPFAP